MCGKNPWGDDDSNSPAIIPRSISIVTGSRSGPTPKLDGGASLREASERRLKAIDETNSKIGPGRGLSKANQNSKRDERSIPYDFKIFVVGGRKQYDDDGEEKQLDEYVPEPELRERTFVKTNEVTSEWGTYFQAFIRSNSRWNAYCSTYKRELDLSTPIELLIFSPDDLSKLTGKGRKARPFVPVLKHFIRAGWPGGDCLTLHQLLELNDFQEKDDVFGKFMLDHAELSCTLFSTISSTAFSIIKSRSDRYAKY